MNKKIKYHKYHSYLQDGKKMSVTTELYPTGVYVIINNNPAMQYNLSPYQLSKLEEKLIKAYKKEEIEDLTFIGKITVIKNERGLWEEIDEYFRNIK